MNNGFMSILKLEVDLIYACCSLIPLVTRNTTPTPPLFPYWYKNKGIRGDNKDIFVTKGIRESYLN